MAFNQTSLEQIASKADVLVGLNEMLKRAKTALDPKMTAENVTAAFYDASSKLAKRQNKKLAKAYLTAGDSFTAVDFGKIQKLVSELYPLTSKISSIADTLDKSFSFDKNDFPISKAIIASYKKKFPRLGVTDMIVDFSNLNSSNSGKIIGTLITNSGKTINRVFKIKNGKVVDTRKLGKRLSSEFEGNSMKYCPHCGIRVKADGEEPEGFDEDEITIDDIAEETGDNLIEVDDFGDSNVDDDDIYDDDSADFDYDDSELDDDEVDIVDPDEVYEDFGSEDELVEYDDVDEDELVEYDDDDEDTGDL